MNVNEQRTIAFLTEKCCYLNLLRLGEEKRRRRRKKKRDENIMVCSNISSTCSHNMVNFGPLAAEIGPVVWGTPANFNGFRVLPSLLLGTLVVGQSQTLRR